MLQRNDLQELPLNQLLAIEEMLTAYLFKQPDIGEPYHPNYRKNKPSFDLLIRQTVKLRRIVRNFQLGQKDRIYQLVHLHKIVAAEADDYIPTASWDIEDKNLANTLADGIFPIYTNGAKTTAENIGIGTTIDSSSAPSQKFLTNYVLKLAGQINDTTKADITQAIATSLELGETRDELTARINDILDDPYRSEMIAQTESINAFNQGRLAVGQEIGYDQKEWQAQPDACEYCSGLDGEIVGIDEQFDGDIAVVDAPALHPWCRCTIRLINSQNVEGSEIKGGWITKDGRHIFLPDGGDLSAINRMDYSQPTKPPTNRTFGRYDAEHMIKYNAALQAANDRTNDPNIPQNIKDLIYNADVGGSVFPNDMAASILRNLPGDLPNNPLLQKTLTNWGKSAQMVWDTRNRK